MEIDLNLRIGIYGTGISGGLIVDAVHQVDCMISDGEVQIGLGNVQTEASLFLRSFWEPFRTSFIEACRLYTGESLEGHIVRAWAYKDWLEKYQEQNRESQWHAHPMSRLTGIMYLRVPDKDRLGERAGTELEDGRFLYPSIGNWAIFPAQILHRPGIIETDRPRYVLSADLMYPEADWPPEPSIEN